MSQKYIHFTTPGPISEDAFNIFGLSAKQSESLIGRFGTGLKYAVAVLLRNGAKVTVKSADSDEIIPFSTVPAIFRGKPVNYVFLGEKKLSFTTDLGQNWLLWYAFRELYSNTLDEGGDMYLTTTELDESAVPEGMSIISVQSDALYEMAQNLHKYFLPKYEEPQSFLKGIFDVAVFAEENSAIFANGIRAYELETPTLYTYNILGNVYLTEERLILGTMQVEHALKTLLRHSNASHATIIERILSCPSTYWEASISYSVIDSKEELSETARLVIDQLVEENCPTLNRSIKTLWMKEDLATAADNSAVYKIRLSFPVGDCPLTATELQAVLYGGLPEEIGVYVTHIPADDGN